MSVVLLATVVTIAMAIVFDFTNGFHDAANATSTVIATKSLTPRHAVWLSAVFNFLPAFVVGTAVANTIAKTVDLDALPQVAGSVGFAVGLVDTGCVVQAAAWTLVWVKASSYSTGVSLPRRRWRRRRL